MNFEIKSTLKGISVSDEETNYLYKSKLFTLSAELVGENGNVVATLKRNRWWNLTFILWTEKDTYKVEQKWGEVLITSPNTGIVFRSNLTTDFYNEKNIRVTELTRAKRFGSLYKLEITDTEHYLALLIASCMLYKSSIEGIGAGIG